ncbi:hypothetical protein [Ornithinibacillus halophilus]|uniref:Uncharacterized protein n=1 Tax=Ornithinibacillus halophilus TaxID=930117 RepID=A0A1M5NBK5_9BACI|nr:hypothetical protein [Ornithinibacillus halophilus]SHG86832.1 hypothetical protein SAMN05216225_10751 [Ornithinibacillus halophilus]
MKSKVITLIIPILMITSYMVNAKEEKHPPEPTTIETYQEDVTGDGHKEELMLKGTLFSSDSEYYRDLQLIITTHKNKSWEINYNGGYKPKLKFMDLNHDSVNEILFQSATGGNGGVHHYNLHTLIQYKLLEIPLPKQEYVSGEFKEDFQVEIKFSPVSDPTLVNVEKNASHYAKRGIYNREGQLLKKTSVIVDPIAYFEPFYISESKGYGLKSFQQISGTDHSDQLGTIESLWYYERDKWIIVQSEWIPSEENN